MSQIPELVQPPSSDSDGGNGFAAKLGGNAFRMLEVLGPPHVVEVIGALLTVTLVALG
jgi:hypothetical protein